MSRAVRAAAAALFVVLPTASMPARGGLIDFETIPGSTPSEGLAISNQFLASEGVEFSLEGGGAPVLAEVGAPATGFGPNDSPLDSTAIGSFFLTDDGVLTGLTAPALIVSYSVPTAAASGVVLDIDFDESFTIEARDEFENVLDSLVISAGDPGTGDRVATFWSISRPQNEIFSLRFKGTRTVAGSFGLGFDNFNTTAIPEPSIAALFGIGLTILSLRARRLASNLKRNTF